jgi:hypothetical protein
MRPDSVAEPKKRSGRKPAEDEEARAEPAQAKNPAAVSLGRLGGLKGGAARAASLTPKRRSQIARRAARARWTRRKRP